MANKPPVFIVGSPRSGTSLLRNLLNRHPNLAISGETRFYGDVYKRRWAFGGMDNPKNRQRLVRQYLSAIRLRKLGVDLAGLEERLLREATSYQALLTCILEYYAESQGKKRYGEKTPHHAFFAETLCEWFPGAAIIHLVRDPRDVVASLQRMPWAPNSIVDNACMWRLFNRAARRARHRPGYLMVHYEKLAVQPEQELARICAHVGEEYAGSMLSPTEPVAGPYSWPRHARGPVTKERLHKWREELAVQEVSLIEWLAGKDMPAYGYQSSAPRPSILTIARGLSRAAADPARRQLAHLPYLWYSLTRPRAIAKQEYWKYRGEWDQTATFSDRESWEHREE
jgi:hypothetical protein